jgi:hypothetical protein
MLGATVQNSVAMAALRPGFVHTWLCVWPICLPKYVVPSVRYLAPSNTGLNKDLIQPPVCRFTLKKKICISFEHLPLATCRTLFQD